MATRAKFIQFVHEQCPTLTPERLDSLLAPHLLSEHIIELPRQVLTQAQNFVRSAFALRSSAEYQNSLASEWAPLQLPIPRNQGILMSYDFHWVPGVGLRLIEINTNAAFLAMSDCLYQARKIPQPVLDFSFDEVRQNILQELMQVTGKTKPEVVAIVDEKPEQQRLFVEFLLYQEHFKKWGWNSQIADVQDLPAGVDFIYNRSTDFYLAHPQSQELRKAFVSGNVAVSPQPWEYFLLADKARMIQWSQPGYLEKFLSSPDLVSHLRQGLPGAWDLTREAAEALWAKRKTLFIKPQRAFGAKQSYKGASISRKIFDQLAGQGFIAQEYIAAPEVSVTTPTGPQNFKYDLRFYAYRDRVQSVIARTYQGQVTNLQTPLGGFAPVTWTDENR